MADTSYNVVVRRRSGTHEGVLTWTSYESFDDFIDHFDDTMQERYEVVTHGVSDERAVEICSTPEASAAVVRSLQRQDAETLAEVFARFDRAVDESAQSADTPADITTDTPYIVVWEYPKGSDLEGGRFRTSYSSKEAFEEDLAQLGDDSDPGREFVVEQGVTEARARALCLTPQNFAALVRSGHRERDDRILAAIRKTDTTNEPSERPDDPWAGGVLM